MAGRHQAETGVKRRARRSNGRHRDAADTTKQSRFRGALALRSVGIVLLAVVGAICVGTWSTITTALKLVATTALIMGGNEHPLSVPPDTQPFVNNYVAGAQNNYLVPGGFCPVGGCGTVVAVVTPEQFFPISGSLTFDQAVAQGLANLDKCVHGSANCVTNQAIPGTTAPPYGGPFVIYGFSESTTIATLEKRTLAAETNPPATSFFLLENVNRPNGGILERAPGLTIPIIGVTFSGATPTDTSFPTIDAVRQYDGVADTPVNPLNLLSDINAALGFQQLHGSAPSLNLSNFQFQGQYGDTSYYLDPTPLLPLLMPLATLGVPTPLLDVLDAPLRVLVEAGYNRTISPGQPTPLNLLYFPNPIALVINLVVSIPTGVDNGLSALGLGRPLGTPVPGPYGVGGPPVDPSGPPGPAPAPLASTISPTTHSAITSAAATDNTSTPISNAAATTTDTSTTGPNSALATTTTAQVSQPTTGPSNPPVTRSSQPTTPAPAPTTSTGATTKPSPPATGNSTAATAPPVVPTSSAGTTSSSTSTTSHTTTSSTGSSTGASSSPSSSSGGSSSSTK